MSEPAEGMNVIPFGKYKGRQVEEVQRSGAHSAILAALAEAETLSPAEIVAATGIGHGTVGSALYRMCRAGEVAKAGGGRGGQRGPRQPKRAAAGTIARRSLAGDGITPPLYRTTEITPTRIAETKARA